MLRLTAWLFCLVALPACAPLAHAQVYRCIGAHGEPVFSGQPCGTPAPRRSDGASATTGTFGGVCPASPGELRQAINDAFQDDDVNLLSGLILWQGIDQASARATLRSLADWLKQPLAGIADVSAAGPPPGYAGQAPPYAAGIPGPAAGTAASTYAAGMPAAATSAAAPPPLIGFRVSTGGGDGSTRDFGLAQSGGCWWLTF